VTRASLPANCEVARGCVINLNIVRVTDNPLGGAARIGERPLRMTTSIIIHYFGWQAGRGLGHSAEMGTFPVKLTAWRHIRSNFRSAASTTTRARSNHGRQTVNLDS
jgi:hypothetical protein